MILDASALLALVFDKEEADGIEAALLDAGRVQMSVVNWMECAIRALRHQDERLEQLLERTIERIGCEIVSLFPDLGIIARLAYRRYGKGSGHAAQLNMGDCFAYALATAAGEALLFKGEDFRRTDGACVLPS